MTPEAFVKAIRQVVADSAIEGTQAVLQQPPGKKPDPELIKASVWFRGLSPGEQELVRSVVRLAVRQAVFGFLAVLDGVRPVDDTSSRGRFELRFVEGEDSWLINAPDKAQLHDLMDQT